ncbi:MAG: MBL fold metallo-hydrolase [Lachnospiraceae bacterium]|nr:MBL fold metallo-hydrolase [Lachnospiraceae bacterium]
MNEIKSGRMVLGSVSTNCYFIYRDKGEGQPKEAIVFDPADHGADIFRALKDMDISVGAIVLTHGHFDHILGVAKLRQLSHCKIYAGADEVELLSDEHKNLSGSYGLVVTVTPDELLRDDEEIELCGIKLKTFFTPGHTPGGCCFYIEEAGLLISGDTLFEGSVGRTDFPGGSMGTLVESVKTKLFPLPDDTKVYPGHGGTTTIGDEKKFNPFLA